MNEKIPIEMQDNSCICTSIYTYKKGIYEPYLMKTEMQNYYNQSFEKIPNHKKGRN